MPQRTCCEEIHTAAEQAVTEFNPPIETGMRLSPVRRQFAVRVIEEAMHMASRMDWISVDDRLPEHHTGKVFLFRTAEGYFHVGDMCYGMHEPYFVIESNPRTHQTEVLNGVERVTHWLDLRELEGPA